MSNPLLLKKRKFHIRVYVLAVNDVSVYVYDEVLILCSGSKYKKHDTSDAISHITNTAYQAMDPNFREEDCVLLMRDMEKILAGQRVGGSARGEKESGRICASILSEIRSITGELFKAYRNETSVYAPIDGCFEYYGLDFLVDDAFNVTLLEVNPSPDFKQTGKMLNFVIEGLLEESIDIGLGSNDKYNDENRMWQCVFEEKRIR